MTQVINILSQRAGLMDYVYIGRPSKWGNPFKIGQDYQGRILTREDTIDAYYNWLFYSDEGIKLQVDIMELKNKTLGCFCKPLACHGDVLLKALENLEYYLENN